MNNRPSSTYILVGSILAVVVLIITIIYSFQSYLYFFYVIYLVVFIVYSAFALRQLERFSYVGDASRSVMIIYITLSISIIVASIIILVFFGGFYA